LAASCVGSQGFHSGFACVLSFAGDDKFACEPLEGPGFPKAHSMALARGLLLDAPVETANFSSTFD